MWRTSGTLTLGRMRVLVVEDERELAGLLVRGLDEAGFRVDTALDGPTAIRKATESDFDALVLDVMLPGASGFEVCAELRRRRVWTPILMLTARDSVEDRVVGLEGGADDYVPKPFAFAELIARLRALGRRGPIERPVILEAGDLRLDPSARVASRGDVELELSPLELALLETHAPSRPGPRSQSAARPCLERGRLRVVEHRRPVHPLPAREDRRAVRGALDRDRPWARVPAAPGRRAERAGVTLLSRLPLRRRVTGTFTLAAAAVLAVLGVYLHVRLVHQLDDQIASALQQRRQDVTALLGSDPQQGFAQLEQRDVNGRGGARDTTQLLSSTGEVLASEGAPDSPLLTEDQMTQARDGKSSVIVAQGRGPEDRIALLAGPVTGGVVVVGASLDQHDNAVHELDRLLLVGLPAALL